MGCGWILDCDRVNLPDRISDTQMRDRDMKGCIHTTNASKVASEDRKSRDGR